MTVAILAAADGAVWPVNSCRMRGSAEVVERGLVAGATAICSRGGKAAVEVSQV
jgi:hypothetical protein